MAGPFNVLFLCTGNSARSILAEAAINHCTIGGGNFRGFSAGSRPTGRIDPLAVELLQAHHIPTIGLRSKSWEEFARADAPAMDFVFTVCDTAAAESCPVWPGLPSTAHWGVPDPAAVVGSEDLRRRAFRDAFSVIVRRISLFACLPLETLQGLALQKALEDTGRV